MRSTLDHFNDWGVGPPGDAAKCASRTVETVSGQGMAGHLNGTVLRLPLGSDCVERIEAKIKSLSNDLEALREAAKSVDHDCVVTSDRSISEIPNTGKDCLELLLPVLQVAVAHSPSLRYMWSQGVAVRIDSRLVGRLGTRHSQ